MSFSCDSWPPDIDNRPPAAGLAPWESSTLDIRMDLGRPLADSFALSALGSGLGCLPAGSGSVGRRKTLGFLSWSPFFQLPPPAEMPPLVIGMKLSKYISTGVGPGG